MNLCIMSLLGLLYWATRHNVANIRATDQDILKGASVQEAFPISARARNELQTPCLLKTRDIQLTDSESELIYI